VTRLPWALLPATLLAGLALAQQSPPVDVPPGEPAAAAPEDDVPFLDELPAEAPKDPAPGAPQPDQDEDQEEDTLPPLPPGQRSTGPTPQRFDPSEEVRADFPVSFPIDI